MEPAAYSMYMCPTQLKADLLKNPFCISPLFALHKEWNTKVSAYHVSGIIALDRRSSKEIDLYCNCTRNKL